MVPKIVRPHQVIGLADTRQHAECQHIDLHQAQRIDIVLVPFDEAAVLHCRIVDRNRFIEPVLREHEPADMLRKVPGKVQDAFRKDLQPGDLRIVGIKTGFPQAFLVGLAAEATPHRSGKPRGHVFGQAKGLADFAHGAFGAIVYDGCGNAGAMSTIAPVDILHDLLTALMLEIDVDIGRLLAV